MTLHFIRHFATPGNLARRYVGSTDEDIAEQPFQSPSYPAVEEVITSPMRRCLRTAALIYPDARLRVIPDFREIDFGRFEYRTFQELNGDPDYQAWIDSGGTLPFPDGESREHFIARTVLAFDALLPQLCAKAAALVVHGGTIMAILSSRAVPVRGYFDWQLPSGGLLSAEWDGTTLEVSRDRRTS